MTSQQPKIGKFRIRALKVPMEQPHRTASGVVSESPLILIDVFTDAGTVGHGIIFTYTMAALRPTAELIRDLATLIEGEPLAPVEIADRFNRRFRLLGTQGLVGMAIAGIDMALWDAMARTHSTSVVRLLGGIPKPIPAYGAVGYDGVSDSARTAESWARRGFKGVKVKIGIPRPPKTWPFCALSAKPLAMRWPSWPTTINRSLHRQQSSAFVSLKAKD